MVRGNEMRDPLMIAMEFVPSYKVLPEQSIMVGNCSSFPSLVLSVRVEPWIPFDQTGV